MRAVLRLFFVIPIAFVLACIAAAFTFVVAVIGVGPDPAYLVDQIGIWPSAPYLVERLPETLGLAAIVSAVAGSFGAIPAFVLITAAEIFGWRSLFLYLGAGLLGGLAAAATFIPMTEATVSSQVFLAAGAVGGFVYWLFAGRSAGLFPPPASRPGGGRPIPSPSPLAGEGRGGGTEG